MSIHDTQMKISTEIKAPKNLVNKFGGYNYRNCEGIFEAVKPYLAKYGASLMVSDKVVQIGDRYYIEATAELIDNKSGEKVSVCALAREAEDKKGMDAAQVTGASSSYARKYALNGLLLLDDTKDPDTDEYTEAAERKPVQPQKQKKVETIGNEAAKEFGELLKTEGIMPETVNRIYGVSAITYLTEAQLNNAKLHLKEIKAKQEEKK